MEQNLSFMERYKRDHQHPINKLTHAIGYYRKTVEVCDFFAILPLV